MTQDTDAGAEHIAAAEAVSLLAPPRSGDVWEPVANDYTPHVHFPYADTPG